MMSYKLLSIFIPLNVNENVHIVSVKFALCVKHTLICYFKAYLVIID